MTHDHRDPTQARIALFHGRPYRRHELLTGRYVYLVQGYTAAATASARTTAFISDEMRADWEANCVELMAFWRSGTADVAQTLRGCTWVAVPTLAWAAVYLDRRKRAPCMTTCRS